MDGEEGGIVGDVSPVHGGAFRSIRFNIYRKFSF